MQIYVKRWVMLPTFTTGLGAVKFFSGQDNLPKIRTFSGHVLPLQPKAVYTYEVAL